jgi:hypothetical protein
MKKLAAVVMAAIVVGAAARAGSAKVDFNPKAEFERYKTWAWAPEPEGGRNGVLADETMRKRVEAILAQQLEAVGLHPAGPNETPDLVVSFQGDLGTGKTIATSAGSIANMVDPGYATMQFAEMRATLIVDLADSSTKTLAWRLYVDERYGGPNDPPGKFRSAVEKGFKKYPPSESARAKKAKELEKK